MICGECVNTVDRYWEFVEGIVCESCIARDPDLLHKYNLYLYDEDGNVMGGVVSANMVIGLRRKQ
jgi:hypothetical protein